MENLVIIQAPNEQTALVWEQLKNEGRFNLEAANKVISFDSSSISLVNTVERSINSDLPNLGAMEKYYRDNLIMELISLIGTYQGVTNVAAKLSDAQIGIVAEIIADSAEFKTINLADVRNALKIGITGGYGPLFNKLDIETVCGWLRMYSEAKELKRAELAELTHNRNKQAQKESGIPVAVKEAFTELLQKIEKSNENKFAQNEAERKAEAERLQAERERQIELLKQNSEI